MIMTYKGHSEQILLAVTQLGKQNTILGITWLKKHNPEINFTTATVWLTWCSPRCCSGCQTKAHEEHLHQKKEAWVINACYTSPLPTFVEDTNDEEDTSIPDGPDKDLLEEGDHIWATGLLPEPKYIWATTSVSQWLTKAFKWNSEPSDFKKLNSPHLWEFHFVISKESFDNLPQYKPWDHAVELVPDANISKSCKVYPLSVSEQKELDKFLKENLDTSWICPSKSLMASPVFFVKKKCGGLWLVQDYQALNAMTVKNKYPLPLILELIAKLREAKYFTKLDIHCIRKNTFVLEHFRVP